MKNNSSSGVALNVFFNTDIKQQSYDIDVTSIFVLSQLNHKETKKVMFFFKIPEQEVSLLSTGTSWSRAVFASQFE